MNLIRTDSLDVLVKQFNIENVFVQHDEQYTHRTVSNNALVSNLLAQQSECLLNVIGIVRNVWIATWEWPNRECLCIAFSESGYFYCPDDYWHSYYPFLKKLSQSTYLLLTDLFPIKFRLQGTFSFFGGFHQFGHFLMDIIPNARSIDLFPSSIITEAVPQLACPFREWESDLVASLLPTQEFLCCLGRFSLINVERLVLPLRSGIRSSHDFISKKVEILRHKKINSTVAVDKVYLTRGSNDRVSRVANHSQIDDFVSELGFRIVACESLSTEEISDLLRHSSLVIAEPYTPLVNFFFFCPKFCQAIVLMPVEVLDSPDSRISKGGFVHLIPYLDRIHFLHGFKSKQGVGHIFDIVELGRVIENMAAR